MNSNNAFELLDPRVKKWVYQQGWNELRDIQEESIPIVLSANTDVIISASTAAGKTEAAFLPACSQAINIKKSVSILYISPLKALINDQHRRLESLCDLIDMQLTPWHGDISQSVKNKCRRNPNGIVLITPESLESLMIREPGWLKKAFNELQYVIIDEYHAFIGLERGSQLQSLMHRLECLLERESRPIPRIALSATLGEMELVEENLRSNNKFPCKTIISKKVDGSLRMQLRGYIENTPGITEENEEEYNDTISSVDERIAIDLYNHLRGDSHLIFANSRKRTENFAARLRDLSEKNHVPNEFFPHHGSLSKELRTELENRLQKEDLPTTAVCTMTLELGIDIGKVNSVAQLTAPHSVASLRQRLGRSGRRGTPSVLRMYISEKQSNSDCHFSDKLRIELVQCIAMLRLLVSHKWYEPADTGQYHFSTLLHQILSVIAQWGGVQAGQLWRMLCVDGFFKNVELEQFKSLLKTMGEKNLISQMGAGQLVLGSQGEKLVDHYTFYAVFISPEEYRLEAQGKTLGTLPIEYPILPEQYIVFAGRRWLVKDVDVDKKVIFLEIAKGGEPPKFGGSGLSVHSRIRQEMLQVYKSGEYKIPMGESKVEYLDETAKGLFLEGKRFFDNALSSDNNFFQASDTVLILPWLGDKVINTLVLLLVFSGYKASSYAGVIEVKKSQKNEIIEIFRNMLKKGFPSSYDLVESIPDKMIDKYDYLLPKELLTAGYAAKKIDIYATKIWLGEVVF